MRQITLRVFHHQTIWHSFVKSYVRGLHWICGEHPLGRHKWDGMLTLGSVSEYIGSVGQRWVELSRGRVAYISGIQSWCSIRAPQNYSDLYQKLPRIAFCSMSDHFKSYCFTRNPKQLFLSEFSKMFVVVFWVNIYFSEERIVSIFRVCSETLVITWNMTLGHYNPQCMCSFCNGHWPDSGSIHVTLSLSPGRLEIGALWYSTSFILLLVLVLPRGG